MLARVWHLVWGLPQAVLGAAMLAALRAHGGRKTYRFRMATVCEWGLDAGFTSGMFVFVPHGCPRSLLVHEYGHVLQSLVLGPLYLPLVVLPSLAWAGLPACRRYRARTGVSYYQRYPESWANRLARRVTGERPQGWGM